MYPGATMKAKVTQRRKVYHARKARLLRRIPAQPTREVKMARDAATVERTSSRWLPTRTMSACVQILNQVRRQKIKATRA